MTPAQRWAQHSSLNDLLNAWNELRNAVLGRGVSKPANVPQPLYDYVGREYLAFRKWLSTAPALTQIVTDYFGGGEKVDEYRAVAFEARRAGIQFRWPVELMATPESMREMLEQQIEKDPNAPIVNEPPPDRGGELPLWPRAVRSAADKVQESLPGAADLAKAFVVGLIAALAIRGLMGHTR